MAGIDSNAPETTPLPSGRREPDARDSMLGFRLEVLDGPDKGRHWESTTDRCNIGSHPSCDLALTDTTVSRFHCEVVCDHLGARVRDLDSRNGTIVDGLRVIEVFLKNQSVLRLGRSVLRFSYLSRRNVRPLSEHTNFGVLTGQSVAMRAVFALLERAASVHSTVLLEGETGTGKSAAARALHNASPRRDGPFLMVDCGAIPTHLLESEFFGHEKGAFTGADSRRIGMFEEASGGTLFLDEVGELPHELQSKLLGVLEHKCIRRVGSNVQQAIDVRIVAATHRDLRAEVNAERFREDLYYRLAVIRVQMPPLRERLDDMHALTAQLLADLGVPEAQMAAILTPEYLVSLQRSAWPGNIRQLRNHLEQVLVYQDLLPPDHEPIAEDERPRIDTNLPLAEASKRYMDAFRKAYIEESLRRHDGNVARVAEAAQVQRGYVYELMRRYDIER
jgi:two-component system response regulator GlrR